MGNMNILIGFGVGAIVTVIVTLALQPEERLADAVPVNQTTVEEAPVASAIPPPVHKALEMQFTQTSSDDEGSTSEQQALYDQILARLNDPDYIANHTLTELIRDASQLTVDQQHQLKIMALTMINKDELDLNDFKQAPKPRHKTVAEGAPLPTPEQQTRFEQISANLYDSIYKESLTFEKLGTEARGLPPALRQELADRLNTMLETGELSARQFYEAQLGVKLPPEFDDKIPLEFYLY